MQMNIKFIPRPTKAVLAIGLTLLIFAAGSYLLGWSSLLTVSQVEITGAPSPASKTEIARKLDLQVGEKLARVDSRALSLRLKTADWIESSDISRNWISGKVRVQLHPRIPVAIYNQPGKAQVALDASGKVFSVQGALPDGLPSVVATSIESGLAAIRVFTEMPKEFSAGITRLSASDAKNLLVYGKFNGQTLRIIWGAGEETSLKIKVINALLEQPENKSLRMIDVTAPHASIVK
jgi:cell division septal protein FtsQ